MIYIFFKYVYCLKKDAFLTWKISFSFAWSPSPFQTDGKDLSKESSFYILYHRVWFFFSLSSDLILWWDLDMILLAFAQNTLALWIQVHSDKR